MKRIIPVILVLLTVIFLFTGCIRMRSTLTVRNDGKIDVSVIYAVMSTDSDSSEEDTSVDTESMDSQGYTRALYSEDGYTGYVWTKNEVTDFEEGILGSEVSLKQDGSRYTIDIPWETDDEDSNASALASAGAIIRSQGGFAEFVIVLPVKPESHNATGVSEDGKTLTWNLLSMGDRTSIHVEYTIGSSMLLWIIIAAAVIAVIIVCVILFLIIKSARKNEGAKMETENRPDDPTDELRKYKTMLDEGLITQDEYDMKKAALLNIAAVEAPVSEDNGPETADDSEQ